MADGKWDSGGNWLFGVDLNRLDDSLVGLIVEFNGKLMATAENRYTEIGAFDAKTRLSELLRKVEQGERFTITRRGRPVAQLVPVRVERDQARVDEAVRNLLNFPRIEGISGDTVLEWIRKGRK